MAEGETMADKEKREVYRVQMSRDEQRQLTEYVDRTLPNGSRDGKAELKRELLFLGMDAHEALQDPEEFAEWALKTLDDYAPDEHEDDRREWLGRGVKALQSGGKGLKADLSLEGILKAELTPEQLALVEGAMSLTGATLLDLVKEGVLWNAANRKQKYEGLEGVDRMSLAELNELNKGKRLPITRFKVKLACQWIEQWNDLAAKKGLGFDYMFGINAGLLVQMIGGNAPSIDAALEEKDIKAIVERLFDNHAIDETFNRKHTGLVDWDGKPLSRKDLLAKITQASYNLKPGERLVDHMEVLA